MKKAIIDLGTNTFNLLIVETFSTNRFQIVHEEKIPVRLGRGGLMSNQILPDSEERAIQALLKFKQKASDFKVDQLLAVGTSAIRNATNKNAFKQSVKEQTDINIIGFDGPTEAYYIYQGVKNSSVLKPDRTSLIMDIGGGSTEFILGTEKQIHWKKSFDLGVARLLERFTPSDPISQKQESEIIDYLSGALKELVEQIRMHQPTEFIGSSGSFDTFLALQKENLKPESFAILDYQSLLSTFTILKQSTLAERKEMRGMHQIRAEFIVLSAILTEYVLRQYPFQAYYQSEYSLKEGLIFDNSLAQNF